MFKLKLAGLTDAQAADFGDEADRFSQERLEFSLQEEDRLKREEEERVQLEKELALRITAELGCDSGRNTFIESTSDSVVNTSPTTASSGQACRFFRKGNCMFGSKCMHLHSNTTNAENKPYDTNFNGDRGRGEDKDTRYSNDTCEQS